MSRGGRVEEEGVTTAPWALSPGVKADAQENPSPWSHFLLGANIRH